jgi:hypothetical protein
MTIQELYVEGKDFPSLLLLIDYLVHERKVVSMTDSIDKLTYYMQPNFHKKMNAYLDEYKRGGANASRGLGENKG